MYRMCKKQKKTTRAVNSGSFVLSVVHMEVFVVAGRVRKEKFDES